VLGPAVQVQSEGLLPWIAMEVDGESGVGWTDKVCQVGLPIAGTGS
jgi:hypothetical protein